jgi:hypothetical protein
MADAPSDTVRIELDVPRSLLLQLRDQLWPDRDPTLQHDLDEIAAKYVRHLPHLIQRGLADPDSTTA